ncbi:MAG: hypothetical protein QGH15_18245, partial [Kiritimatiellia bacterium]|nr:hypothetical protein [Kiritimatiellia bacterium]
MFLYEYAENRGKPAVLKDLVGGALDMDKRIGPPNSLLVFTDANTYYAPDALHQLAEPFSDPNVGGVCGRVILHGRKAETGKQGEKAETGKLKAEMEPGQSSDTPGSSPVPPLSAFSFQPSAFSSPPEGS